MKPTLFIIMGPLTEWKKRTSDPAIAAEIALVYSRLPNVVVQKSVFKTEDQIVVTWAPNSEIEHDGI